MVQSVKDRRDRRDSEGDPQDLNGAMGVIAQQDEDIDTLLGVIDVLKAAGTSSAGAGSWFPYGRSAHRRPCQKPR